MTTKPIEADSPEFRSVCFWLKLAGVVWVIAGVAVAFNGLYDLIEKISG